VIADTRWGAYIHVPWCRRRCPYCAFYVEVDRGTDWRAFADAVVAEVDLRRPSFAGPPSTVFFGGGTPSRMPPPLFRRLVTHLNPIVGAEVSAEINPEDVTPDTLAALRDAGITRASVGLQTMDNRFAPLLNRACTIERASEVAREVAEAGFESWSADVMFALPGQTLGDLDADLDRLLAADPPHVSLYGLTIEPGTPFERGVARGALVPVDDDTWREMYDHVRARLAERGYEQYEVSNFARPGHRSRHNRLYWTDRPYLGVGPSAHGLLPDGTRYANIADARRYLTHADPTDVVEPFEPRARAIDLLISNLRHIEGFDIDHCVRVTGLAPRSAAVAALIRAGALDQVGATLRLTPAGFPIADGVAGRLADALAPAST
jgi:oxygen-independent coproporphyrinogen-3 oxidase